MDLVCLGKKALFVPTPGQTEQKYLADYFYKKGIFLFRNQEDIDLLKDVPKALMFPGIHFAFDYSILNDRISKLLMKL